MLCFLYVVFVVCCILFVVSSNVVAVVLVVAVAVALDLVVGAGAGAVAGAVAGAGGLQLAASNLG